ncbi:YchJ family protein [Mycobacterium sp.]|uniref:YchJ family protein n=1 Tax=Mycobacterium sp. TaxID=1785 RepID=UPI002B5210D9|nr:YchJ family protein [Mycobacterium sp.]HTQ20333.1 YchJ family protein [Mycobacterium sp.]
MARTVRDDGPCPCGSGDGYADCCRPLHRGERGAQTALALMRSRFSAFALGDAGYLLTTWHPSTRPRQLDLDNGITWRRLQIVDTVAGTEDDATGVVDFRAQYEQRGSRHIMRECSRFTRDKGRWLYLDGDVKD